METIQNFWNPKSGGAGGDKMGMEELNEEDEQSSALLGALNDHYQINGKMANSPKDELFVDFLESSVGVDDK